MSELVGGEEGLVQIVTHLLSILAGIFGYKKFAEKKTSNGTSEQTKLFIEFSACVREQHKQHQEDLGRMTAVLEEKARIMARITEMLLVMGKTLDNIEKEVRK